MIWMYIYVKGICNLISKLKYIVLLRSHHSSWHKGDYKSSVFFFYVHTQVLQWSKQNPEIISRVRSLNCYLETMKAAGTGDVLYQGQEKK